MSRSVKLLLLLLALQAGLVAWVNIQGDEPGAVEADEPLLALDLESADAGDHRAKGDPPVAPGAHGRRWVLSGKGDFPVAPAKFEEFAEKLLKARRSWPVGRTLVAARKLRVTEEDFERRVRFLKGTEVLGDVFLGSSPGFRKVHARLDGDELTHAIDFNAFDAPPGPGLVVRHGGPEDGGGGHRPYRF